MAHSSCTSSSPRSLLRPVPVSSQDITTPTFTCDSQEKVKVKTKFVNGKKKGVETGNRTPLKEISYYDPKKPIVCKFCCRIMKKKSIFGHESWHIRRKHQPCIDRILPKRRKVRRKTCTRDQESVPRFAAPVPSSSIPKSIPKVMPELLRVKTGNDPTCQTLQFCGDSAGNFLKMVVISKPTKDDADDDDPSLGHPFLSTSSRMTTVSTSSTTAGEVNAAIPHGSMVQGFLELVTGVEEFEDEFGVKNTRKEFVGIPVLVWRTNEEEEGKKKWKEEETMGDHNAEYIPSSSGEREEGTYYTPSFLNHENEHSKVDSKNDVDVLFIEEVLNLVESESYGERSTAVPQPIPVDQLNFEDIQFLKEKRNRKSSELLSLESHPLPHIMAFQELGNVCEDVEMKNDVGNFLQVKIETENEDIPEVEIGNEVEIETESEGILEADQDEVGNVHENIHEMKIETGNEVDVGTENEHFPEVKIETKTEITKEVGVETTATASEVGDDTEESFYSAEDQDTSSGSSEYMEVEPSFQISNGNPDDLRYHCKRCKGPLYTVGQLENHIANCKGVEVKPAQPPRSPSGIKMKIKINKNNDGSKSATVVNDGDTTSATRTDDDGDHDRMDIAANPPPPLRCRTRIRKNDDATGHNRSLRDDIRCEHCGKAFHNVTGLKAHFWQAHKDIWQLKRVLYS